MAGVVELSLVDVARGAEVRDLGAVDIAAFLLMPDLRMAAGENWWLQTTQSDRRNSFSNGITSGIWKYQGWNESQYITPADFNKCLAVVHHNWGELFVFPQRTLALKLPGYSEIQLLMLMPLEMASLPGIWKLLPAGFSEEGGDQVPNIRASKKAEESRRKRVLSRMNTKRNLTDTQWQADSASPAVVPLPDNIGGNYYISIIITLSWLAKSSTVLFWNVQNLLES